MWENVGTGVENNTREWSIDPYLVVYDPAEADLEHFWNDCCGAGFLGEPL